MLATLLKTGSKTNYLNVSYIKNTTTSDNGLVERNSLFFMEPEGFANGLFTLSITRYLDC
jgi:hypothetical protein